MILVISADQDVHAQAVFHHLEQNQASARLLDLSHFPQKMQLVLSYNGNGSPAYHIRGNPALDLDDCKVIWWRRPQSFTLHQEITDQSHRSFTYTECYEAFSGLWLALDVLWINHPTRDEVAARKVYQLKLAQETGFNIPDTLITNEPGEARAFIQQHGHEKTVYKAFSGTLEAWRETRILKADEISLLDNVRFAPVIFQEYIPARCDLRITIVGKAVFAGAIYAQQSSYPFDYRMDMADVPVEAFELPANIIDMLHRYMDRLGLIYGAIDMRITPEGKFVFLEINPAGQWLFIEERTKQPIAETLARFMLDHDV